MSSLRQFQRFKFQYHSVSVLDFESSTSSLHKTRHRWNGIRQFVILAYIHSSSIYNFDIFSKCCSNVRLIDFMICQVTVGITYMFMDGFIKQYSRRHDNQSMLNPLLKGINYGAFIQTSLIAVMHTVYLTDALKLLLMGIRNFPKWRQCQKEDTGCIPVKEVIYKCKRNITTSLNRTSVHYNLINSNNIYDRSVITTRYFLFGLMWIIIFFLATVTEETAVKMFKVAFKIALISTIIIIIIILTSPDFPNEAASNVFFEMVDLSDTEMSSFTTAMTPVAYSYGIGFLGMYDFESVSPDLMIDTATILFMLLHTTMCFMRSWVVGVLYKKIARCVKIELTMTPDIFLYSVLPMTIQSLNAHKIFTIYIYGNLIISTLSYITNLIKNMAKFLHYEITSVKQIYIIGILCCLGSGLSAAVFILTAFYNLNNVRGFSAGLDAMFFYLSSLKVAVVMWVYGVRRFKADIQFWHGFKPTTFWIICWAVLPIILFWTFCQNLYQLHQSSHKVRLYDAYGWMGFVGLIVAAFHIKTISKYLINNNIVGLFRCHKRYGAPDAEDRKRRRNYNVNEPQTKCTHNCMIIDESVDCDHNECLDEEYYEISSSNASLMNLYSDPLTSSEDEFIR